ncbi:MAG: ribonuclease PH [Acidobacteriota bacterium]|nr:ribonuclease PH [Acidobacteriota bacterium]
MRTPPRGPGELRPVHLELDINPFAEGSCRIRVGGTEVICTASVEDRVPPFLYGSGEGWVTAEYGMLPRATGKRNARDRVGGRPNARAYEIQRLVGRSLRAVVDRKVFGERTIWVDCDVVLADGGTRCAAVTGGFVALAAAFEWLARNKKLGGRPLLDSVAAISAGVVAGEVLLDLDYAEDSAAEVDLNVVCTGGGRFVEIQGTAEEQPFGRERLDEMLTLALDGLERVRALQAEVLGERLAPLLQKPPGGGGR